MKIFYSAAKPQISWVVSLWWSPLTFVWPGVPKDYWLGLIGASSNSGWKAIWRYILYIDKICCYTSQLKSKANLKIKYDFKKSIWLHGGHNIAYWPKQVRRSFVCLSTSPNAKTCVLLKISKWKGSFSYIQSSVRSPHGRAADAAAAGEPGKELQRPWSLPFTLNRNVRNFCLT